MSNRREKMQAQEAGDGRHRRSERSRQLIIDALFKLIRSGDMDPSAARVAETANVSLRTVFRHFKELDKLYAEMTQVMQAKILPETMRPLEAADWRDRLAELADRRAGIFEELMPLRICADARRFQSKFLQDDYKRFRMMERGAVEAILPQAVRQDESLAAGFDVTLCFDTWRRLRIDSGMSQTAAREAVGGMLDALAARA